MKPLASFFIVFFLGSSALYADLIEEEDAKLPKPSTSPKKDELLDHADLEPTPKSTTLPGPSPTKKTHPKQKQTPSSPVRFSSKGMRASRKDGKVFLEEDVIVTQDDMRMESNEAIIFLDGMTDKVIGVKAVGKVKFFKTDPETQQPIKAEAHEAYFDNAEQRVTLRGEPKLWRGGNKMVGRTIKYDLKTGWARADNVGGVVEPSTVKQSGKK